MSRQLASLVVRNLRRAVAMAAVVGTVLVLINHGDHIECEPVCDRFYLKASLSYAVPFCVSLVSALLAERKGPGSTDL